MDMTVLGHWAERVRSFSVSNPLLIYGRKYYSQNDEDGIISEICRRVGLATDGVFVEFGVDDGLENNSILLLAKGWHGVWIGGQELAIDRGDSSKLCFLQRWVTRENCVPLIEEGLAKLDAKDVDIISMDLDGNDLYLCEAILSAGWRPCLFVVEYNGKMPPPIRWSVRYDAKFAWDKTDYMGASLQSFVDLFDKFNYQLVACNITGVNAFFVNRNYENTFPEISPDPTTLFMPPDYNWFLTSGHRTSPRTISSFISNH